MKKVLEGMALGVLPIPNLIVSSRCADGTNNALAVGFACSVSSNPPQVMIGIVPEHYSYQLIKESGEFVINIPPKGFEKEYYYLGSKSGRDEDKFASLSLIWEEGKVVKAPLLDTCPVCIECKVIKEVDTGGDHRFFVASIEAFHCDESLIGENGGFDFAKAQFL